MKAKPVVMVILICIIFTIFWSVFYPPIYAIHDEAGYMAQAYVMRNGTIFGDIVGIHVVSSVTTASGHRVPIYAPGTSFLLIPFTFLGWKTIFLLPLILHLIGFLVFLKILKIYKISPNFSLLYLLYPTSVLYSRTIMADIPSAVFFILACYFFLRGKRFYFLSGFFFGILPLFRFPNIILAIPFFVYLIIDLIKSIKKSSFLNSPFLKLLLGFIPGLLGFLFYNNIAFGGFLNTSYDVRVNLSLRFLPHNLSFYFLSLSIIYPFMFFSIFFLRKYRFLFISSAFLFLLFYSIYYYFTIAPGKNMLKTLIVGMRYLLPIVPIFILSYGDVFERIKRKIPVLANIFFWFIVIVFSILNLGMVYQHQGFLKEQERYKNRIYENTEEKSLILTSYDGMEFFQPAWGKRKYAIFVFCKDRIPVDFAKYDFDELFLLTVVRSDKEWNEYVKKYAEEIVEEYNGVLIAEIKGDPELRLWRLEYERENESETEQ